MTKQMDIYTFTWTTSCHLGDWRLRRTWLPQLCQYETLDLSRIRARQQNKIKASNGQPVELDEAIAIGRWMSPCQTLLSTRFMCLLCLEFLDIARCRRYATVQAITA